MSVLPLTIRMLSSALEVELHSFTPHVRERRRRRGSRRGSSLPSRRWRFEDRVEAVKKKGKEKVFVKDMAPPKVYLFDEIVKHKKTEDCWPNISGEVAFFPSSICTTNSSSQDLTLSMQPLTFPGNLLSIDQCLTDCLDASLKSCFAVALSH
ncbi:hypothetical protein NC653_039987 [Populus alba x Populus x berolinensis]|uniref:Uncharacterized protein n=1 Tax=Populus alba x Populus x berolinensis TaxID=444605 RepID=A0AAD6LCM7_9ROSI|nr:hypothetical protein NC653_039987 [Populus alba x Populus x berolinensis]